MTEKFEAPKVGEGATYTIWTDSIACTVIAVSKSGKTVTIQEDKATLLNGFNSGEEDALKAYPGGFAMHVEGNQRYSYEPNSEGRTYKVTLRTIKLRKGGHCYAQKGDEVELSYRWKVSGHSTKGRGGDVRFGVRSKHFDYNF